MPASAPRDQVRPSRMTATDRFPLRSTSAVIDAASARRTPCVESCPYVLDAAVKRVFHVDIEHCGACGRHGARHRVHRDAPEVPLAQRARLLIEKILTHLAARETRGINRPRAPPLHAPQAQPPDSPSPALSWLRPQVHDSPAAPRLPCPSACTALRTWPFMSVGSKSRHLDRDWSALAPTPDPTTTTPVLPQPSQSTRYAAYPYFLLCNNT